MTRSAAASGVVVAALSLSGPSYRVTPERVSGLGEITRQMADQVSRRLGYQLDGSFYDRQDLVTELARRLPKLTVNDVNAAVRRHLSGSGIKVVIVAPDADGLAKALTSGAPTPITYDTKGTPEIVLKEDETIASFPLKDVSVKVVPVGEMFQK